MAGGDDPLESTFQAIQQTDEHGIEYWSARDLARVLGYARWDNFERVIDKAVMACENSGCAASDHFNRTGKMIALAKGAHRTIEDWHLSRYACYLIVQNADPSNEIVALGQTYFAVQTRRAEVADELAVFQDHGYRGLYNGVTARDIAARKGVKPGQILDYMGSTELAANLFRATQAEEKLRREHIVGKETANRTHHAVGREVRATIERLGGTMPEELPTSGASIQQLQRREQQRIAAERQPSLFDGPAEE
jgi:DNA-damage-inducible protein D